MAHHAATKRKHVRFSLGYGEAIQVRPLAKPRYVAWRGVCWMRHTLPPDGTGFAISRDSREMGSLKASSERLIGALMAGN